NRAELERMIGFFANTLAIRADLSGNPTFRELVGRVRQTNLSAYANQEFPFEKLVQELSPERSLSHNPLFQVIFSLHNVPMGKFELAGLELSALEQTIRTSKFDVSLYLIQQGPDVWGLVEYNRDLFDAATIERMVEHYLVLLGAAVEAPETRLSDLPLMSAREEARVLREWNETSRPFPRDLCIHELFEQQVASTPHAVALVFRNQRFTYAELNRISDRLAGHLRSLGIGPESSVVIMAER